MRASVTAPEGCQPYIPGFCPDHETKIIFLLCSRFKEAEKKKLAILTDVYLKKLCVDLEFWDRTSLLLCGFTALLDALEQMVDSAWNDAQLLVCDVYVKASPHSVRLP